MNLQEERQKESLEGMDSKIIKEMVSVIFENLKKQGLSEQQAKDQIVAMDPFNNYEDLVNEL